MTISSSENTRSVADLETLQTGILGSLDALETEHEELYQELHDGFETPERVVVWLHKAAVHTLGQLPDEWFAGVAATRYTRAALLNDPADRAAIAEHHPDERGAAFERELIGDGTLAEACNAAMRLLDEQANEYGEAGTEVQDPTAQKYPAMRAGLYDAAVRQRKVLETVLGLDPDRPDGLGSMDELRTWRRSVSRATRGRWMPDVDLWHRTVLLGDPASPTLHVLLARECLPAMNAGLRVATQASEETRNEDRPNQRTFNT